MKIANKISHKKLSFLIVSLLLAVALIISTVGITYAIWKEKSSASKVIEAPIVDFNPSAKHIIYKGINADGSFTDVNENIAGYAVVGYNGLISELIIPASYKNKPVTRICPDSSVGQDQLTASHVITSIIIPHSVVFIAEFAMSGMPNLVSVVIKGNVNSAEIAIGDYAFAQCHNLKEFVCNKKISDSSNRTLYLAGTGTV